jgi:hypothetical protein
MPREPLAQSAYLETGEQAVAVAAAAVGGGGATARSAALRYATGRWDLGFDVGVRSRYVETGFDDGDERTTTLAVIAGGYLLRQGVDAPLNVQGVLLYQRLRVSDLVGDYDVGALSGHALSVGLGLSRDLKRAAPGAIVPEIGLFFTPISVLDGVPVGSPQVTGSVGVGFGLPIAPRTLLMVEPGAGFSFTEGDATYGLSVGLIQMLK